MRFISSVISMTSEISVRWNSITSNSKISSGVSIFEQFFSTAPRARSTLRSGCSRVVMMMRSLMAKCSQPRSIVSRSNSRWQSTSVPNTMFSSTVMVACVSWVMSAPRASSVRPGKASRKAATRASTRLRCNQMKPSSRASSARSVGESGSGLFAPGRKRYAQTKPGIVAAADTWFMVVRPVGKRVAIVVNYDSCVTG